MLWSSAAILIVAVSSTADAFRRDDGDDDDAEWIRLCTLTNDDNGGSVINVTMPCGVRVRGESADSAENQSVDQQRVTAVEAEDVVRLPPGDRSNNASDGDRTAAAGVIDDSDGGGGRAETVTTDSDEYYNDDDDDDEDDDDHGVTVVSTQDDGDEDAVTPPTSGGHNATVDGDVTIAEGLDEQGGHPDDTAASDGDHVTAVQVQYEQDDYGNRPPRDAVLAYIQEAKNRLYDKIHNLLSFLRHAYFNSKFNRRIRRDLVERQMPANERRLRNKKKQSFASTIMQPTFERSMMTMSFLMFGVFVIQVVQRLMQTLQQSGEMASMGSSIIGSLPKILPKV